MLGEVVLGDVVLGDELLGELVELELPLMLGEEPPAAPVAPEPDLLNCASHSARETWPSPFVSTDVKLGVEALLLELDEPPAALLPDADGDEEDGDEEDGLLDEDEDCATASVDSAKSTAVVVMLRVLGMEGSCFGWNCTRMVCKCHAAHYSGLDLAGGMPPQRRCYGAAAMRNLLLDALPKDVTDGLQPYVERQKLERGKVLHSPGDTIKHLYFPLNCLVSITVTVSEGKTAEAGAVGNREVVGVNAFMGGRETNQTEYIVQIEGEALKIEAQPLRDAFDSNKAVRDVFLKYTQAYIAQLSQNVACNRLHNVEQRFTRWLLEVYDRIDTMDLRLTQEFIGEMLGVQRPTVTDMATRLVEQGLISVQRGLIRISNLEGLERLSCECRAVVTEEYDRLLGRG
ncbi:MAG TPA: Crp/Fnr family transcriptional regulator [Burkholderiales bacterium]|nr:Crp/Fnr family transcriptional regulator [Burkholderiales bacterium]